MKRTMVKVQSAAEVCREELEHAIHKIENRLEEVSQKPASGSGDKLQNVRRFYEDLTDKSWTESDEAALSDLSKVGAREILQMMRDAYRHSAVMPIPSFGYLINMARKLEPNSPNMPAARQNSAISALERERLANLLCEQLNEAAEEIISTLDLGDTKCGLVRARLVTAQGHIISHLSPLV